MQKSFMEKASSLGVRRRPPRHLLDEDDDCDDNDSTKGSLQANKRHSKTPFRRKQSAPYLHRFASAVCVSSLIVLLLKLIVYKYSGGSSNGVSIVFSWKTSKAQTHIKPLPTLRAFFTTGTTTSTTSSSNPAVPDYGNLTISSSSFVAGATTTTRQIQIHSNDYAHYESYRHQLMTTTMNNNASEPVQKLPLWHDDEISGPRQCYRNNWSRAVKPVCNHFHETRLDVPYWDGHAGGRNLHQDYDYLLKAKGSFVHVWVVLRPDMPGEYLALKRYKLKDTFPLDIKDIMNVQTEAVVMEAMTPSERFIDIYGYCGFDTMLEGATGELSAEVMPSGGFISQELLDTFQPQDVFPLNNLTLLEKLDTGIFMAEAIAELHGYKGGVITHGDLYPSQFLRTRDGKLKLNDFNSAEILDWDPWNERYCKIERCHLDWNRAPEDLTCGKWPADEGMDTYCMGNNLYSLMTGLWSFYWAQDNEKEVLQEVMYGNRTYIDPRYRTRSMVESKLIELMEASWLTNLQERMSIFEILRRLREIRVLYEKELQLQGSSGGTTVKYG